MALESASSFKVTRHRSKAAAWQAGFKGFFLLLLATPYVPAELVAGWLLAIARDQLRSASSNTRAENR
jgi:hypothetical protein